MEEIGNIYPREYSRMFYEGQKESGQEDIVNLVRCAWLGSQKYGALVWSGRYFLNLRGLPQTDLRRPSYGIVRHSVVDDRYRWIPRRCDRRSGLPGAACALVPVWHLLPGYAYSRKPGTREEIINKAGEVREGTGADNEVWSFGEKNYEILTKFIGVREKMRVTREA